MKHNILLADRVLVVATPRYLQNDFQSGKVKYSPNIRLLS